MITIPLKIDLNNKFTYTEFNEIQTCCLELKRINNSIRRLNSRRKCNA